MTTATAPSHPETPTQDSPSRGRMPWQRWRSIRDHAAASRGDRRLLVAAVVIAVLYNIVGVLDVVSTVAGMQTAGGVESNPLIRLMMAYLGNGWVIAKFALQLLVSAMIVWFPHRLVLGMFTAAVILTGAAVVSNLHIAGFF